MIETKLNYVEYEKKTPLPAEKINEIQRCIVADENEIERIDNSIKDNYYSKEFIDKYVLPKNTKTGNVFSADDMLGIKGMIYCKAYNSKNLLKYPYVETTKTESGITFTDNGDGSITINGTATANVNFNLQNSYASNKVYLQKDKVYIINGCPSNGAFSKQKCYLRASNLGSNPMDYGYGALFTSLNNNNYCGAMISVTSGTTITNQTVYPGIYECVGDPIYSNNLITFPYYENPRTRGGLTFTYNDTGEIVVNGTASEITYVVLKKFKLEELTECNKYVVSGGVNANCIVMVDFLKDNISKQSIVCTGTEQVIDFSSVGHIFDTIIVKIGIAPNIVCSNVTFSPQFEKGEKKTTYNVNKGAINVVNYKNKFLYPYYNGNYSYLGMNFTDNGDGSITINGTAGGHLAYVCNYNAINEFDLSKKYIMSGGNGTNVRTNIVFLKDNTIVKNILEGENGHITIDFSTIDKSSYNSIRLQIYILKDTVCNNLVIKPQIEEGETVSEYCPNRYLKYKTPLIIGGENIFNKTYYNNISNRYSISNGYYCFKLNTQKNKKYIFRVEENNLFGNSYNAKMCISNGVQYFENGGNNLWIGDYESILNTKNLIEFEGTDDDYICLYGNESILNDISIFYNELIKNPILVECKLQKDYLFNEILSKNNNYDFDTVGIEFDNEEDKNTNIFLKTKSNCDNVEIKYYRDISKVLKNSAEILG